MDKVKIKVVRDGLFSSEEEQEIINLHHIYFQLPDEKIIEFLKSRDQVHLFYDNNNNRLVGTIGIQWFKFKRFVVMYLGGIVVHDDYLKDGILTRSIIRSVIKTKLLNPLKKGFVFTLATTPDAYRYFAKFGNYYPRPGESVPPEMIEVYEAFLESFCPGNMIKKDGVYLSAIKSCPFALQPLTKQRAKAREDFQANWFREVATDYEHGQQLVVSIPINARDFVVLSDTYLKLFKKKWISKIIPAKLLKFKNICYGSAVVFFASLFSMILFDI